MNEYVKTSIFALAALLSLLAANFISPSKPGEANTDLSGMEWFPAYVDPGVCTAIDVSTRDAETGELKRFRVERTNTGWRIPSNHSYPADNASYVKQIATDFIGLERVGRVTNLVEEHGKYDVIDPTDAGKIGSEGRGWRITFSNAEGTKIADYIVGQRDAQDSSLRYVRAHGENEVYTAKLSTDLSTDFSRWVDTDILKLGRQQIKRLRLNYYSLDEANGQVKGREVLKVKKNEGGTFEIDSDTPFSNEDIRAKALQNVLKEVDLLAIADVEPKADNVIKYLESGNIEPTPDATRIPNINLTSLGKTQGLFQAREPVIENGQPKRNAFGLPEYKKTGFLFGNDGEIDVTHEDGLVYTLRFGNSVTRKVESSLNDEGKAKEKDYHYLMVSVTYDQTLHPAPVEPKKEDYLARVTKPVEEGSPVIAPPVEGKTYATEDEATKDFDKDKKEYDKNKREWETKKKNAQKRADDQNKRFAKWFYLIEETTFARLHLPRSMLVKPLAQPVLLTTAGERIEQPGGLIIECIEPATAADAKMAARDKRIKVLYQGKLIDGTIFDEKQDRTNPYTFKLSEGKVIEGWDDGLLGMKVGEKRKLIVPPSMAYGDEGFGDKVGPGAQLEFVVELIEVLDK